MGDCGVVIISLKDHAPAHWERLVLGNPRAKTLEVRIGDATPTAASLESLSRLAEANGLSLRMRA